MSAVRSRQRPPYHFSVSMNTPKKQPSLTIVSITGDASYAQGSAYAIQRSYHQLKHKIKHLECLLISPEAPAELADFVKFVPCKNFTYIEYNLFVLYSLAEFITTDFVLIVQNDGWVLNGESWRDEFFEYDFIGAPLHTLIELRTSHPKVVYHQQDYWLKHSDNPPANHYQPLNGGFSLRSKRLLNAPFDLGLNLEISPPLLKLDNSTIELSLVPFIHHEDIFLTAYQRPKLEAYGLRFAPLPVALHFAFEDASIHRKKKVSITKTLGCHCMSIFVLVGENKALLQKELTCGVENDPMTNSGFLALMAAGMQISIPAQFAKYLPALQNRTENWLLIEANKG